METLPDGFIDYNRLKLILAILEYEYGIVERDNDSPLLSPEDPPPPSTSSKRKIPTWMTSLTTTSLKDVSKKPKLF